jgi:hypothetical protein
MRGNFEDELARKRRNTVVDAKGWIFGAQRAHHAVAGLVTA